jgi:PKHD-type hydroxylase
MVNYKHIINKNIDDVDQSTYFLFKDGFSDEEINRINIFADMFKYKESSVFNGVNDGSIRKSKLKWLPDTKDSAWFYTKMFELANIANNDCYKFRLHYAEDHMQYTLYEGNSNGKYDWHIDIGSGVNALRKLSAVLLLTDPSEFTGGELQIFSTNVPVTVPLVKGSIVFFPSFLLHRVTPVTSGERKTLVFWMGGDHYQ